jgi:purine-binding chemotaxis protein CheW
LKKDKGKKMEKYEDINEINSMLYDEDEDTQADRYLAFKITTETYAVEIKYVIEIVGIQKITEVPNIKPFIKGIINLRGNIIPVVDVRKRFGLAIIDYNDRTCIIVVSINNTSVGLIVDEVQEVLNIPEEQISQPPQTNKGSQSRFIQGIGKIGDQVKILLNINSLLYDYDDHLKEISEQ